MESRSFDVLAANRLARAVSPQLRPGVNRMRGIFLDPDEREFYQDWDQVARSMVAGFRASIGTDGDDPRIVQLVGELSLASEPFRRLWARHDVAALSGGSLRLRHPQLGPLELSREKLPLADSGGQILAIYHAAPGSAAARGLDRLRTLAEQSDEADDARGASGAASA